LIHIVKERPTDDAIDWSVSDSNVAASDDSHHTPFETFVKPFVADPSAPHISS